MDMMPRPPEEEDACRNAPQDRQDQQETRAHPDRLDQTASQDQTAEPLFPDPLAHQDLLETPVPTVSLVDLETRELPDPSSMDLLSLGLQGLLDLQDRQDQPETPDRPVLHFPDRLDLPDRQDPMEPPEALECPVAPDLQEAMATEVDATTAHHLVLLQDTKCSNVCKFGVGNKFCRTMFVF